MNNKIAAICGWSVLPLGSADVNNIIGSPTISVTNIRKSYDFSVTNAELVEKQKERGGFVEVSLSAKVTESSLEMENKLIVAENLTCMIILHYTDGSQKLVGSPASPVFMLRKKSGKYAATEVTVTSVQPEFAKYISQE